MGLLGSNVNALAQNKHSETQIPLVITYIFFKTTLRPLRFSVKLFISSFVETDYTGENNLQKRSWPASVRPRTAELERFLNAHSFNFTEGLSQIRISRRWKFGEKSCRESFPGEARGRTDWASDGCLRGERRSRLACERGGHAATHLAPAPY